MKTFDGIIVDEADVRVIHWKWGVVDFENTIGKLLCELNGVQFWVSEGIPAELRYRIGTKKKNEIFPSVEEAEIQLPKLIKIQYEGLDENSRPMKPVFHSLIHGFDNGLLS